VPLLTLFSAPKPFTNPHIALIQRNAIRSWASLGPDVEVILLGEEAGLAETAAELGVRHLAQVERSPSGTPLVSSMFALARQSSSAPLLCCVNADILLLPDLLEQARQVQAAASRFLVVGQRWDLDVRADLDFSPGWPERLRGQALTQGRLHKATGSDYFLFPRECFTSMPPFTIGRAGWDNWMIYAGRRQGWPVVDASEAILIIHQNHDYSHLPGGQPHYHHPETDENVRLAGGRRAIFELPDADYRLTPDGLTRKPLTRERLRRELEIFPLVRLGSVALAEAVYFLLYPRKAYREWKRKKDRLKTP
jgi:hypothetical protein